MFTAANSTGEGETELIQIQNFRGQFIFSFLIFLRQIVSEVRVLFY